MANEKPLNKPAEISCWIRDANVCVSSLVALEPKRFGFTAHPLPYARKN